MKAKNKKEKREVWWMMVHALDIIRFTFLDNLYDEDLDKAEEAYYTLLELSNKYHE